MENKKGKVEILKKDEKKKGREGAEERTITNFKYEQKTAKKSQKTFSGIFFFKLVPNSNLSEKKIYFIDWDWTYNSLSFVLIYIDINIYI